ncbi:MAG: Holliday junction branch migration protein RuvA [Pseudomonadales bacterium]|nr:Holliday junction branch migration protein RuvA [Pseudomonadales bacterium]
MIGRLRGRVIERTSNQIVLDVNGVGYEVDVPLTTWFDLEASDREVMLYTHLVVREDAQLLYGFSTENERALFRALIRVNGVGPKMAITILSGVDAVAFARCVETDDVKTLTALPGVGKKTAERLIIEMRDRLPALGLTGETPVAVVQPADHLADAESALVGLGFRPQDAAKALARVEDPAADVESLIRQALRNLV